MITILLIEMAALQYVRYKHAHKTAPVLVGTSPWSTTPAASYAATDSKSLLNNVTTATC